MKMKMKAGAVAAAVVVALAAGVAASYSHGLQDAVMARVIDGRVLGLRKELHDTDALNVVFCGTGSPVASPERGAPCIAVFAGKDLFLIDSGGGAGARLTNLQIPVGGLSVDPPLFSL